MNYCCLIIIKLFCSLCDPPLMWNENLRISLYNKLKKTKIINYFKMITIIIVKNFRFINII